MSIVIIFTINRQYRAIFLNGLLPGLLKVYNYCIYIYQLNIPSALNVGGDYSITESCTFHSFIIYGSKYISL